MLRHKSQPPDKRKPPKKPKEPVAVQGMTLRQSLAFHRLVNQLSKLHVVWDVGRSSSLGSTYGATVHDDWAGAAWGKTPEEALRLAFEDWQRTKKAHPTPPGSFSTPKPRLLFRKG